MGNPIRIGFIGAGHIAGTHLRVLAKDPRARVAGVYDISKERAQASGAPVFESAEALLDAVDAVYLTLPNRLHAETALKVIEHGKHVFCEKPLTVTLEDARRVEQAAARSDKVFQVGHNRRFAPVYRRLKDALGRIAPHCAVFKMNRGELEKPAWIGDESMTGGYLFETPIHMFDIAAFLLGDCLEVMAWAGRAVYTTLDTFTVLLRFASGGTATLVSCAYSGWSYPTETVEIYGQHATLRSEEMDLVSIADGLASPAERFDYRHLPSYDRWGYVTEDRLFLDSIEQAKPPAVTAADGVRAVRMALAVYESARTGSPVKL